MKLNTITFCPLLAHHMLYDDVGDCIDEKWWEPLVAGYPIPTETGDHRTVAAIRQLQMIDPYRHMLKLNLTSVADSISVKDVVARENVRVTQNEWVMDNDRHHEHVTSIDHYDGINKICWSSKHLVNYGNKGPLRRINNLYDLLPIINDRKSMKFTGASLSLLDGTLYRLFRNPSYKPPKMDTISLETMRMQLAYCLDYINHPDLKLLCLLVGMLLGIRDKLTRLDHIVAYYSNESYVICMRFIAYNHANMNNPLCISVHCINPDESLILKCDITASDDHPMISAFLSRQNFGGKNSLSMLRGELVIGEKRFGRTQFNDPSFINELATTLKKSYRWADHICMAGSHDY